MSSSKSSPTSGQPTSSGNENSLQPSADIAVIGMGNLGSALAQLIAENQFDVLAYDHCKDVVNEINTLHSNQHYLANQSLPELIIASDDISHFQHCKLLFVTLPSRYIESTLAPLVETLNPDCIIANLAKGMDCATEKTAFQKLRAQFPKHDTAMLSGPSLANEFSQGIPTCVVAACENPEVTSKIAKILNNAHFVVQASSNPFTTELGGILKNVYAIGFGIISNTSTSELQLTNPHRLNFVGAYLTQAFAEIKQLAYLLGVGEDDLCCLDSPAGIGDLITTCLSTQSHNFNFGALLGQGKTLEQAVASVELAPEGLNTLKLVKRKSDAQAIKLPLLDAIHDVVRGNCEPEALSERFIRAMQVAGTKSRFKL